MGVLTLRGKNTLAYDFIGRYTWYVAFTRCDFSFASYPWQPNDTSPPSENPGDSVIVNSSGTALLGGADPVQYEDLSTGQVPLTSCYYYGIKKVGQTSLVTPVGSGGSIVFNSQQYNLAQSSDIQSYHVYWKTVLEPTDFTVESDGFYSITGYRRISLLAADGILDPISRYFFSGLDASQPGRPDTGGFVFFYDNGLLKTRGTNERHTIEILLPIVQNY